jgi:hypothetical protein
MDGTSSHGRPIQRDELIVLLGIPTVESVIALWIVVNLPEAVQIAADLLGPPPIAVRKQGKIGPWFFGPSLSPRSVFG